MTEYSARFRRNVRLTHHVYDRMGKRTVSLALVLDLIETGDIRFKTERDVWIYRHYPERDDNLVCLAVTIAEAVIVKTVMVGWKLEEDAP